MQGKNQPYEEGHFWSAWQFKLLEVLAKKEFGNS